MGFVQWCLWAYSLERRETRPPARQHAHDHLGCTVNQDYSDRQCCFLSLASWSKHNKHITHNPRRIDQTENTCEYRHFLTNGFKYGFCVVAGFPPWYPCELNIPHFFPFGNTIYTGVVIMENDKAYLKHLLKITTNHVRAYGLSYMFFIECQLQSPFETDARNNYKFQLNVTFIQNVIWVIVVACLTNHCDWCTYKFIALEYI